EPGSTTTTVAASTWVRISGSDRPDMTCPRALHRVGGPSLGNAAFPQGERWEQKHKSDAAEQHSAAGGHSPRSRKWLKSAIFVEIRRSFPLQLSDKITQYCCVSGRRPDIIGEFPPSPPLDTVKQWL